MELENINMAVENKKMLFPWVKIVNKKFSKAFTSDYETEALQLFYLNMKKEVQNCLHGEGKNKKRIQALFINLSYFYNHFIWKICQKQEDSSEMKVCCAKLLSHLIQMGLVLSGRNISSQWIERILTAIRMFPADKDYLYSALLMISNLGKKYHDLYAAVLKHTLLKELQEHTDNPVTYVKLILLFRRLKMLLKNHFDKTSVLSRAARIKPPLNVVAWLSSLNISYFNGMKLKIISKQLIGKKVPKDVIEKLRKEVLGDNYLEESTEAKKHKVMAIKDMFVIDTCGGLGNEVDNSNDSGKETFSEKGIIKKYDELLHEPTFISSTLHSDDNLNVSNIANKGPRKVTSRKRKHKASDVTGDSDHCTISHSKIPKKIKAKQVCLSTAEKKLKSQHKPKTALPPCDARKNKGVVKRLESKTVTQKSDIFVQASASKEELVKNIMKENDSNGLFEEDSMNKSENIVLKKKKKKKILQDQSSNNATASQEQKKEKKSLLKKKKILLDQSSKCEAMSLKQIKEKKSLLNKNAKNIEQAIHRLHSKRDPEYISFLHKVFIEDQTSICTKEKNEPESHCHSESNLSHHHKKSPEKTSKKSMLSDDLASKHNAHFKNREIKLSNDSDENTKYYDETSSAVNSTTYEKKCDEPDVAYAIKFPDSDEEDKSSRAAEDSIKAWFADKENDNDENDDKISSAVNSSTCEMKCDEPDVDYDIKFPDSDEEDKSSRAAEESIKACFVDEENDSDENTKYDECVKNALIFESNISKKLVKVSTKESNSDHLSSVTNSSTCDNEAEILPQETESIILNASSNVTFAISLIEETKDIDAACNKVDSIKCSEINKLEIKTISENDESKCDLKFEESATMNKQNAEAIHLPLPVIGEKSEDVINSSDLKVLNEFIPRCSSTLTSRKNSDKNRLCTEFSTISEEPLQNEDNTATIDGSNSAVVIPKDETVNEIRAHSVLSLGNSSNIKCETEFIETGFEIETAHQSSNIAVAISLPEETKDVDATYNKVDSIKCSETDKLEIKTISLNNESECDLKLKEAITIDKQSTEAVHLPLPVTPNASDLKISNEFIPRHSSRLSLRKNSDKNKVLTECSSISEEPLQNEDNVTTLDADGSAVVIPKDETVDDEISASSQFSMENSSNTKCNTEFNKTGFETETTPESSNIATAISLPEETKDVDATCNQVDSIKGSEANKLEIKTISSNDESKCDLKLEDSVITGKQSTETRHLPLSVTPEKSQSIIIASDLKVLNKLTPRRSSRLSFRKNSDKNRVLTECSAISEPLLNENNMGTLNAGGSAVVIPKDEIVDDEISASSQFSMEDSSNTKCSTEFNKTGFETEITPQSSNIATAISLPEETKDVDATCNQVDSIKCSETNKLEMKTISSNDESKCDLKLEDSVITGKQSTETRHLPLSVTPEKSQSVIIASDLKVLNELTPRRSSRLSFRKNLDKNRVLTECSAISEPLQNEDNVGTLNAGGCAVVIPKDETVNDEISSDSLYNLDKFSNVKCSIKLNESCFKTKTAPQNVTSTINSSLGGSEFVYENTETENSNDINSPEKSAVNSTFPSSCEKKKFLSFSDISNDSHEIQIAESEVSDNCKYSDKLFSNINSENNKQLYFSYRNTYNNPNDGILENLALDTVDENVSDESSNYKVSDDEMLSSCSETLEKENSAELKDSKNNSVLKKLDSSSCTKHETQKSEDKKNDSVPKNSRKPVCTTETEISNAEDKNLIATEDNFKQEALASKTERLEISIPKPCSVVLDETFTKCLKDYNVNDCLKNISEVLQSANVSEAISVQDTLNVSEIRQSTSSSKEICSDISKTALAVEDTINILSNTEQKCKEWVLPEVEISPCKLSKLDNYNFAESDESKSSVENSLVKSSAVIGYQTRLRNKTAKSSAVESEKNASYDKKSKSKHSLAKNPIRRSLRTQRADSSSNLANDLNELHLESPKSRRTDRPVCTDKSELQKVLHSTSDINSDETEGDLGTKGKQEKTDQPLKSNGTQKSKDVVEPRKTRRQKSSVPTNYNLRARSSLVLPGKLKL